MWGHLGRLRPGSGESCRPAARQGRRGGAIPGIHLRIGCGRCWSSPRRPERKGMLTRPRFLPLKRPTRWTAWIGGTPGTKVGTTLRTKVSSLTAGAGCCTGGRPKAVGCPRRLWRRNPASAAWDWASRRRRPGTGTSSALTRPELHGRGPGVGRKVPLESGPERGSGES